MVRQGNSTTHIRQNGNPEVELHLEEPVQLAADGYIHLRETVGRQVAHTAHLSQAAGVFHSDVGILSNSQSSEHWGEVQRQSIRGYHVAAEGGIVMQFPECGS